jgi:signal transduction histidine kinase
MTWVLTNLLTNAIRYSPENERVILRVEQTSTQTLFSIQDLGIGIAPEHHTKLFDKFFQVPGTAQGTGLGLAISKEFIEAQGGEISVSSEPGKGSTFTVKI